MKRKFWFVVAVMVTVVALVYFFKVSIFSNNKYPTSVSELNPLMVKIDKETLLGVWQDSSGGEIRFEFGGVSTESPGYNDIYEGMFYATSIGEDKKDFKGWFNLGEDEIIFLESEDPAFPIELVFATKVGEKIILTTSNGEYSFAKKEN